jgi:two-component system, NtrC family, sensor histidine kinase HydH
MEGNAMRMNRRTLYFPAVTLTALTITLTGILAISTYRNLHREQAQMEESLTREGLALLRLFRTVTHSQSHTLEEEAAQVQRLAQAVTPNEDIAQLYLFNQQGTILAHTDLQQVGTRLEGGIPKGDEILTLRREDAFEHLCEIRSAFHPVDAESATSHYLGICLKVNTLEHAHLKDRRHTMMMAAMLILLGSGSLFFILVVQNFYLVQRTLNQMKSYIHYVVESMANGLISLDSEGAVTTMNRAAQYLLGCSEAEVKSLEIDRLLPEYAPEIREVLQNSDAILNKEIVYHAPDGSAIPVNLSATQVKAEGGVKLGVVVLLHDLREMVALQERAKRAEHLASIGRMAATVAHEIRNPLSSIRGFAQFFANLFGEETEERTYALAMIEESNRLNRVVSELLDYARPLELKIESTSIETLFLNIVRRIELEKATSGVEVIQEIQPDIPQVQLDRDRILQVLLNLTQNSLDAMPDGGKLILSAIWLGEQKSVQLKVQDTGKGISHDELPKLFEPFFTTKARGAGLGLALVRKIIDAHRGNVDVQSEEGVGTKVILTLPQPTNR